MSRPVQEIHGRCDDRFERVRRAFEENSARRGELGAAVSIWRGGECVVDLWGGVADRDTGAAWTRDTVVNVWSSTKGVTAICFAMAVDRGLCAYEDRVSAYWPEFAAAGKEAVTIGMLLSHQAGLTGFDSPATVEAFYDADAAADRLAAQRPFWPPGSRCGYHAISLGFLATALFRRIEGRGLRAFVAEELNAAAGLDLSIGVADGARPRLARIDAPEGMRSASIAAATPAQRAALANPDLDPRLPNTEGWRGAEIPSANGVGNARALAALYARLLPDAAQPLIGPAARAAATAERIAAVDLVMGAPAAWAAGFALNRDGRFGPNPAAYGHGGWGGSYAFADPAAGVAMSYTMNRMSDQPRANPRGAALVAALYDGL
jgi:CubicO group peptidase (beta-lactamase class C family)